MRGLIIEKSTCRLISVVLNTDLFDAFKQAGVKMIYLAFNPTIEPNLVAKKLGPDVIVVMGFDEGGSMPDQAMGRFRWSTASLM